MRGKRRRGRTRSSSTRSASSGSLGSVEGGAAVPVALAGSGTLLGSVAQGGAFFWVFFLSLTISIQHTFIGLKEKEGQHRTIL